MIDQLNPVSRLTDLVQPQIAEIARTVGLGNSEWGAKLQAVLDTPGGIAAFRQGFIQGVGKGAEDFVVGIASLAGRAVQYGADNTPLIGSGGDALRGLVKTPLGAWAWSLVLGGEASLACPVPGEWRLTAPEADFRAFTSERPRRDGFTLELAVPDSAPLQVRLEVDVRDSRRRQVASAGSG